MRISKMNLYLDLDDVVFDTTRYAKELYKEYARGIDENKYAINLEDSLEDIVWLEIFDDYSRVPIMHGAVDFILTLKEYFNITFVSSYITENERTFKEGFSEGLGIPIILLDIRLHTNKSCVSMFEGIFVDDNLENLKTSSAKFKILFDSSLDTSSLKNWLIDGSFKARTGIETAGNWEKLYERIMKIHGLYRKSNKRI